MSRIRKGYEARFRGLLRRVGTRRLEQGIRWLIEKARRRSLLEGSSEAESLAAVYAELAARPAFGKPKPATGSEQFWCDAGLGGLARWLRAAGHIARWDLAQDDSELLQLAQVSNSILLTTDSLLMERRLLRDGIVRSLWIPPTLRIAQQLALVFDEFGLQVGEPRCMRCGGELQQVDKQTLKDRIPPRTFRWLDEYFVCGDCDQLFWRGTHWEKIRRELGRLD